MHAGILLVSADPTQFRGWPDPDVLDSVDAGDFAGRHEMFGKFGGQFVSVELQCDEVHRQRELVRVQHSVAVNVRQFPDFAENRVRQLRLHQLRLGRRPRYLAVDWIQALCTTANHSSRNRVTARPMKDKRREFGRNNNFAAIHSMRSLLDKCLNFFNVIEFMLYCFRL